MFDFFFQNLKLLDTADNFSSARGQQEGHELSWQWRTFKSPCTYLGSQEMLTLLASHPGKHIMPMRCVALILSISCQL